MRRAWGGLAVLAVSFLLIRGEPSLSMEFGFRDDFHFSVREEFTEGREFQVDNYVFLDAYRVMGPVDFHTGFLITNDLNLYDTEAVQLSLAYLTIDPFESRLKLDVGRQLFSPGFDLFLGDGLLAKYQVHRDLSVAAHFGVPFDAENQAIDEEPFYVYGVEVEYGIPREAGPVPFKLAGQVERREPMDPDSLDQILLGLEGLVELNWPLANDLYADVEYEAMDNRVRRVKGGTALYLTPMISCRLEGDRYDPEDRLLNQQFDNFFQDVIVRAFSQSEVVSGRAALTYLFPRRRELKVSYALQRYIRRSGEQMLGNEVDCYLTFLSLPSVGLTMSGGYFGRMAEEDYVHLGVFRTSWTFNRQLRSHLLLESGVLNSSGWQDRFVLHVRGSLAYQPWSNLEVSVHLEDNQIPYFDYDLRAMTFVRYFWGGQLGW